MLDVVANALRSPTARIIEECCGYYQNENGVWGYYVTVWHAGHYHMISVSHVEDVSKLNDIARALESPLKNVTEDGRYRNQRRSLGYWATVRSGDHWYMVSVSDMLEPYHRQWWADSRPKKLITAKFLP
jgi:hypothetical protein